MTPYINLDFSEQGIAPAGKNAAITMIPLILEDFAIIGVIFPYFSNLFLVFPRFIFQISTNCASLFGSKRPITSIVTCDNG